MESLALLMRESPASKNLIQGVIFPLHFSSGEKYDTLVKLSKEKSWRNRSRKEGVMKLT
jgi:hypothetical protein